MAKFIPEVHKTESGHLVRRMSPGVYLYRGYTIRGEFTFSRDKIPFPQQDERWEFAAILNPGDWTGRSWEEDAFLFSSRDAATAEIDRMIARDCQTPRDAHRWFCGGYDWVIVDGKKYTSYREAMRFGFGRDRWGRPLQPSATSGS
jgi:hypothetical protein|tara:strand:+ start:22224 stop:22661 length:438 start_codon:yes stop_codon:yes gene_type:complete